MSRVAKSKGDTKHITLKRESYRKLLEIRAKLDADTWEETIEKIKKRLEEYERRGYKPVY